MSEQVLVLDDEQDAVDNILLALKLRNIKARGDTNPRSAIESFRADPTDVVIVDYLFPPSTGMTGVNVIAEMQAIKPFTIFILISGYEYKDLDEQTLTDELRSILRAERFLRKPINLEKVIGIVQDALAKIENKSRDWKQIAHEHVGKSTINLEEVRNLNDQIKDALIKAVDESDAETNA